MAVNYRSLNPTLLKLHNIAVNTMDEEQFSLQKRVAAAAVTVAPEGHVRPFDMLVPNCYDECMRAFGELKRSLQQSAQNALLNTLTGLGVDKQRAKACLPKLLVGSKHRLTALRPMASFQRGSDIYSQKAEGLITVLFSTIEKFGPLQVVTSDTGSVRDTACYQNCIMVLPGICLERATEGRVQAMTYQWAGKPDGVMVAFVLEAAPHANLDLQEDMLRIAAERPAVGSGWGPIMSADYKTLHELQTLDEWAFDDRGRLDRLFERSPRFLRWMDGVGQMQQHVRSLEGRLAALQKGQVKPARSESCPPDACKSLQGQRARPAQVEPVQPVQNPPAGSSQQPIILDSDDKAGDPLPSDAPVAHGMQEGSGHQGPSEMDGMSAGIPKQQRVPTKAGSPAAGLSPAEGQSPTGMEDAPVQPDSIAESEVCQGRRQKRRRPDSASPEPGNSEPGEAADHSAAVQAAALLSTAAAPTIGSLSQDVNMLEQHGDFSTFLKKAHPEKYRRLHREAKKAKAAGPSHAAKKARISSSEQQHQVQQQGPFAEGSQAADGQQVGGGQAADGQQVGGGQPADGQQVEGGQAADGQQEPLAEGDEAANGQHAPIAQDMSVASQGADGQPALLAQANAAGEQPANRQHMSAAELNAAGLVAQTPASRKRKRGEHVEHVSGVDTGADGPSVAQWRRNVKRRLHLKCWVEVVEVVLTASEEAAQAKDESSSRVPVSVELVVTMMDVGGEM